MSNESSEEIIAEMRKMPLDVFIDANANPVFKSYANRLEAAKRREDEKHSEEVQSLQRTIKKLSDALAEHSETPYNMGLMRDALKKCIEELEPYCDGGCRRDDVLEEAKEALEKPYRNCDMFGGDYKMLHTAWFDWTGSPSGQNPDGTAKMGFGEWLLESAGKRGAV